MSESPLLELSPAEWRSDLKFFADELPAHHVDAFHFTSRAAFANAVAALDARLDCLCGDQVFVGLEQIARMVGDGHTGFLFMPQELTAQLPINVQHFGEAVRVIEASGAGETLLGLRLTQIDDLPIDQVRDRVMTVTPSAEGDGYRLGLADNRMTLGPFLHGLGVTEQRDRARVTGLTDDGRTITADLVSLPITTAAQWVSAAKAAPLMRQSQHDALWCKEAAPSALYCDFRGYQNLPAPALALQERVANDPPSKLIVDLRSNGGGNYLVGLHYMVDPIRDNSVVNRKGRLFVLIGPMTFSAAMSNAAHFRQRTAATLVGEPIGERPNSYQENRQLTLPNSQLVLSYSTKLYEFAPGDLTNEIRPDVLIPTTWADYQAGRDPVLEWVLAQPDAS